MQRVPSLITDLIPPPERVEETYPEWRIKGIYYLNNAVYNGVLDILNFAITVFIMHYEGANLHVEFLPDWYVFIAFILQGLFLLDVIANLIVTKPSHILQRKMVIFEIVLQLIGVLTIIY